MDGIIRGLFTDLILGEFGHILIDSEESAEPDEIQGKRYLDLVQLVLLGVNVLHLPDDFLFPQE